MDSLRSGFFHKRKAVHARHNNIQNYQNDIIFSFLQNLQTAPAILCLDNVIFIF